MLPGADVPALLGLRAAQPFIGAFDGLDQANAARPARLDLQDPLGSANVVWAQPVGGLVVVGSPQSAVLMVIDPATGMFYSMAVGLDSWWRAGTLTVAAGVRRDLSVVIRPATAAFAKAQRLIVEGASRQDAFNQ